ncbi:hypothetical protein JG687_00012196 [Phytophthora cactorum]|uniref:DUF7587 domain-containing protein n=1 Tax=Phytophthora cactorum TaxID=29920 RepID=A0A329RUN5_9STRA|nr:hypothetical protein PC112_g14680 [Phytophthora cactorum]KAG2892618.1 hypothetical protein PC114_g16578 [Phytophthora cactorum]KAG3007504.1 hypothetical protein PC119_g14541 [Phytophthora cactorum]KAG3010674.1 hypothetical protein PC120_g14913 [Phytophthora cactorum]KAG3175500.1 hypothetical protein PC128_g17693 [Phytophthora cactorum]
MATSKIVAQYECRRDQEPVSLYRACYSGSESLKARSRPSFKSTSELKTTVELHLKWCNCEPIPFVSLLANEDHAMSWSQCLLEHGYHDVFVVEINSSRLLSLFWVQELVNHQGVATNLPPYMYADEILVLRKIP